MLGSFRMRSQLVLWTSTCALSHPYRHSFALWEQMREHLLYTIGSCFTRGNKPSKIKQNSAATRSKTIFISEQCITLHSKQSPKSSSKECYNLNMRHVIDIVVTTGKSACNDTTYGRQFFSPAKEHVWEDPCHPPEKYCLTYDTWQSTHRCSGTVNRLESYPPWFISQSKGVQGYNIFTLAPWALLWSFGFMVSKSPIRIMLQIPQWWQFDSPSLLTLFLSHLTSLLVFVLSVWCLEYLSLSFVSGVFLIQHKIRHYVQAFAFYIRINFNFHLALWITIHLIN